MVNQSQNTAGGPSSDKDITKQHLQLFGKFVCIVFKKLKLPGYCHSEILEYFHVYKPAVQITTKHIPAPLILGIRTKNDWEARVTVHEFPLSSMLHQTDHRAQAILPS